MAIQDIEATTEKESERKQAELLPPGEYRVKLVTVGEVRESTFTNKDGTQADDYAFLTFEITQGKRKGRQFDSSFPWTLRVSVDDDGDRTWISPLREMIEAFIGREMKDGERGAKLLERIIDQEQEATALVLQKVSKDKKKTYNKIENMQPIEDDEDEPAPVKKKTPKEILDGDGDLGDEPF
jgi:hypothetical protein